MNKTAWKMFAAAALFAPGGTANALELAVRGRAPEYAIVRAADASPSVAYAAEELRDFTERITGVCLPILTDDQPMPAKAIVLGRMRYDADDSKNGPLADSDDAFRLVAKPPHLFVEGSDVRSVLYGVYELLERFGGCRWYSSWHTVVPARDRFEVPDGLDDTQVPAFPVREPYWHDVRHNPQFAARLRVNSLLWDKLGEKYGGDLYRFGGGLVSCHTFERLLPPEKYFDDHPEYFSLVKGTRLREQTQLCLTNPDVLRLVTSNVLDRIRKDPTAKFYGVSQNDWHNYCECPSCAAVDAEEESHAGTMVRFVNAIAEAVEKEFPDKIIETLAYQYTRKPPKKTKLRHNVMPCLCTIECDFSRPLPASPYHQNVKFVDDIKKWSAQTPRLFIWDYVTDFLCYPYPFPDVYALQDNVRFFRDNGVYSLFEQGDGQGSNAGFSELKAWLLAKWMWNPELPMKDLLDDFFAGFYGAGAPFVREYFEELHRLHIAYTSADTNRCLNCHTLMPWTVIPGDFWDKADRLMDRAAAAVKGDAALEYNIRTVRFGVDHVIIARLCGGGMYKVLDMSGSNTGTVDNERCRVRARRALAFVKESKHVRLCSSQGRHADILRSWRELADGSFTVRTDGVVEDKSLSLGRLGEGNKRISDPNAEDGSAVKIFNPKPRWSVTFPIMRATFAPGKRYLVQMRLRADLTPGRKGPGVTAGLYDSKSKSSPCSCSYAAEKLSGDYAWYDIGTFDPAKLSNDAYLFVGDGYVDRNRVRFVPALYLDKIRFVEYKDNP